MPQRTLDEYLSGEQRARELLSQATPVPPVATLSTGGTGGSWMQGSLIPQSVLAANMVSRAMPVMPPAMPFAMGPAYTAQQMAMGLQTPGMQSFSPGTFATGAGVTGAFTQNPAAQQALMSTAGYLDPSRAAAYMGQQWGQRAGAMGNMIGGTLGGFAPGGPIAGIAGSVVGGLAGDLLFNNPVTRGVYSFMNRGVAQDLSMMANLQHRTAGRLQMGVGDAGLGGVGLGTGAAFDLGQRYSQIAGGWAAQENRGRGIFNQVGKAEIGTYKRDLVQMTEMAGNYGLLDAASNIDQITDTVQKLMKVMGRMAKVTGDPDFRNNLREIANLRAMGLTIEQAVDTTRGLAFYSRAAGVSRTQLMEQGGQMGMTAFGQAGLAAGPGMLYGASAQARARQLTGAFSPLEEQLMGGREGIAQKLVVGQAQFAGPAMTAMMSNALTLGPGGQLSMDPGRMAGGLQQGQTFSGMAGQSQQRLMQIARQMAQQTGRSVQDVMAEVINRLPMLQSEMAQRLGPEGMLNLQLGTMASLGKTMGLQSAATLVGGSAEQGQLLLKQATDPAFISRRRAQLQEELQQARQEMRDAAATARERREDERSAIYWSKARSAIGIGDESIWAGAGRYLNSMQETHRREHLQDVRRQQDEAAGVRAAYFGRDVNEQIMQEMRASAQFDPRTRGQVDLRAGGLDRFAQMHEAMLAGGITGTGTVTAESLEASQVARGMMGIGSWVARTEENIRLSVANTLKTGAAYNSAPQRAWIAEVNKRNAETLKAASFLEREREGGAVRTGALMRQLTGEFKKRGLDSATTHTLRAKVITYASNIGQNGGTIDMPRLREEMYKGLRQQNPSLSEAEAKRIIEDNALAFNQFGASAILSSGDGNAIRAVKETKDTAGRIQATNLEELQKEYDTAQERRDEGLERSGIAGRQVLDIFRWKYVTEFTREERAALGFFTRKGTTAEQTALEAIVAASEGGEGISQETKDEARAEIGRLIEQSPEMAKRVTAAQEQVKKMRDDRADTTVLGKIAQAESRSAGGLKYETFAAEIKRGRGGKEGRYAAQFAEEAAILKAERLGGKLVGGKIVLPSAEGEVEGEAKTKIEETERQLKGIEDLQDMFSTFGTATQDFKIGAEALKDAVSSKLTGAVEQLTTAIEHM